MNLDRVIAVRNNKTIYRDGDRCIKVFNEEYSKADVLNEALNQARIEETGLNIPKVLEVAMIDGKWAIVSEFIKGKTLAQLMAENEENKEKYINILVDLQMSVHQKTCPLLNKLKDKMSRKIAETDLDATTRYDLHTRLEGMPKHNKVCHGDFNPSNIIITEDGTPYILDWSHATQVMHLQTLHVPIFSSGLAEISPVQSFILKHSAKRAILQSSTFRSGCPSLPHRSRLRVTSTSVSSL